MAVKTLYIGASFLSVAAMPAPNRWRRTKVKKGVMNEAADGTGYAHRFGQKAAWQGEWDDLSSTDLTTLTTEYERTRSLALVDFDSTSWTVNAVFQGMEVQFVEGTNPPLYNVRMMFQER